MAFDLKDPETKAAVDKLVQDAVEAATTDLKKQNFELIGQVRKLKKGGEIDPDDHARIERELDEARDKLAASEKALKTANTDLDKTKKLYEAEAGVTRNLLIENGLAAALTTVKVKPELRAGAMSLLMPQTAIVVDGDKRVPKIGDKSLGDFVVEWAKGDGKAYVLAAENSGTGAPGGDQDGVKQKTMTRAAFDALDATAKSKFSLEGGAVTD